MKKLMHLLTASLLRWQQGAARELVEVGSECEMNSVQSRLKSDILAALSRVYAEDRELLSDNIDVCERSLMHRFTHYFMDLVESGADGFYEGLHVDGEYNRHGVDPKRSSNSLIFPDVIVHRRGDDSDNLCVIEFKKSLTTGGKRRIRRTIGGDVEKLQNMTIPKECGGEFGYQWGVHIVFHVTNDRDSFTGVKMRWFHNGVGYAEEYQKYSLPFASKGNRRGCMRH